MISMVLITKNAKRLLRMNSLFTLEGQNIEVFNL